jgi:hypothetical protein
MSPAASPRGVQVTAKTWTSPADVIAALARRWAKGEFLRAVAAGQIVTPLAVPVRGPSARQLADDFGSAQDWARSWQAAPFRVEYAAVGGRLIGVNRIPAKAWIDDDRELWRLLGTQRDVTCLLRLQSQTTDPALRTWLAANPLRAVGQAQDWPRLLAVVEWIQRRGGPQVYLRQIDVPGVDTKFVDSHRPLVAELLDVALPAERVFGNVPRNQFAGRYGLAAKPTYIRLRRLTGESLLPGTPAELAVRLSDLPQCLVAAERAIIVENEITYLALPSLPGAVAVLGGGYGVHRLGSVPWLKGMAVQYWGDLDTHGFAILHQLRQVLPQASSVLMDRQTLESHRQHWGTEPTPTAASLPNLTGPENELYRDLMAQTYGQGVRLEQERIRFSAVTKALTAAL